MLTEKEEMAMMTETAFEIGVKVACTDGGAGDLKRVILNPLTTELTHLVVVPTHGKDVGQLVPIEYLAEAGPGILKLSCALADLTTFESAEEAKFVPVKANIGRPVDGALAWPYYGMTLGMSKVGGNSEPRHVIAYDRVPMGEVSIRRGDTVHATDGAVGHVAGLVIHNDDHHVTHVLLKEGHLWGKKEVAIPIGSVKHVAGEVQCSLTKEQIRDLPEVGVESFTAERGGALGLEGRHAGPR
jgi:hypothetical protein